MKLITLEEIKTEFDELTYYGMIEQDFEHYLKEHYIHNYDTEFNFIGYERSYYGR
jgi:hypothetical protein